MAAGFRPATDIPLTDPISDRYGLDPAKPVKVLNPSLIKPEVAAEIDGSWELVKRPGIVTFVVDTSGSMMGDKLRQAKEGLHRALANMARNNPVGMVTFSDGVNAQIPVEPLAQNRFTMADTVHEMKAGGETALYDAIRAGIEMTDSAEGAEDAIRAVVVLTDGRANRGQTGMDDLVEMRSDKEQPISEFDGFQDDQLAVDVGGRPAEKTTIRGAKLRVDTAHHIQIFTSASAMTRIWRSGGYWPKPPAPSSREQLETTWRTSSRSSANTSKHTLTKEVIAMRAVLSHLLGSHSWLEACCWRGRCGSCRGLDRWSGVASWMLFWGLLGYVASVVGILWSRGEDTSSAGPEVRLELSEMAVKSWLRRDAACHPASLLPLGTAVVSGGYALLLAPGTGGPLWATMLLGISLAVSGACFLWRHTFRYQQRYGIRVQELLDAMNRERTERELVEAAQLRQALEAGFSTAGSVEGLKVLTGLVCEYEQLQTEPRQNKDTDTLSVTLVPSLAAETYSQGLSALSDAWYLMKLAPTLERERLEREIDGLEVEVEALKGDQRQSERLRIREDTLESHRGRLDMLVQLEVLIDQLLYQAGRCEASLHRARLELGALRTGSSEKSVSSVIGPLRETLSRAKEVQDELRRLGY